MTVFDLKLCPIRDDQSNEFLADTNETTLRKMNKKTTTRLKRRSHGTKIEMIDNKMRNDCPSRLQLIQNIIALA